MNDLTPRERDLVALGAALGSNCVLCIEHLIPGARKAGLTDAQISEVIHLADKVRQVPARKALDAALHMLPETSAGDLAAGSSSVRKGQAATAARSCCE